MACGDYSNHCNKAGYYSYCTGSNSYQNSTCYNWTNASECGGNYHVNNVTPCYQNVAHVNWANNKNWSNSPACGSTSNHCDFGNSCSWGGNWCQFGNSCSWGGNWCQFGNSCSHYNVAGWNNNWACGLNCVCNSTYTDSHTNGCWSQCVRGNCQVQYYNNSIPGYNDSCRYGYSNSCASSWGNACYYGYPNSCATSWGDACYTGYPNSCYYYANHNNTPPFNNFCNHADTYY